MGIEMDMERLNFEMANYYLYGVPENRESSMLFSILEETCTPL